MVEIVGVKFRDDGRVYSFGVGENKFKVGDKVIVETSRGIEYGEIVNENHTVPDSKIVSPLKNVLRYATDEDLKKVAENRRKEKDAFAFCEKKIEERGLEMKLAQTEITFDGSKILFFFTAEGRVDFRELVKDLAGHFHTRIELRQIGVRDEAKMLGGLGICGQPFCCTRFLDDFQPVSIKMAKEQGLSLNPTKISGSCGRLMCCLKYEQDAYEYLNKLTPKVGAYVKTPEGNGIVTEVNLLRGKIKVKLENSDYMPVEFLRDECMIIGGMKKKAEKEE